MRVFTEKLDVINKQIKNTNEEDYLLRHYPFHEARTRQALFTLYRNAVELMYTDVDDPRLWPAILARLGRKLSKRYKEIKSGKI